MGDYDFRPGGSLKLKGDKKKKKKLLGDAERAEREADVERQARARAIEGGVGAKRGEKGEDEREGEREREGSASVGAGARGTPEGSRRRTAAEEKFDRIQEERRRERARKHAGKTHKDRVADFNAALDRLSEHHDLPRIGPG